MSNTLTGHSETPEERSAAGFWQRIEDPRMREYLQIALILAVVTLIEFIVVYIEALKPVVAPLLILLSAYKFALVGRFFMHLKYDDRLFSWSFLVGLTFALGLGIATVLVLHYGRGV